MTKNIQIPRELFIRLLQYFQDTTLTDDELIQLSNQISSELSEKLDKLVSRELFTKYKTSTPTAEQREQARQKYLDSVGISEDWRTEKEVPNDFIH